MSGKLIRRLRGLAILAVPLAGSIAYQAAVLACNANQPCPTTGCTFNESTSNYCYASGSDCCRYLQQNVTYTGNAAGGHCLNASGTTCTGFISGTLHENSECSGGVCS